MRAFNRLFLISIVFATLAVFTSTAVAGLNSQSWPIWNKSDESNRAIIDHSTFDGFLKTYVVTNHPSGINRFRYGDVSRRDSKRLDAYIVQMTSIDPRQFRKREQKAYWLNLYNALTIQSLLKKYPGAPDTRKLNPRIRVAGIKLRRADIGDRILRPIWHDYKVIFGLSCASVGCPAIQASAYTAANINKLLKQSAREFINHPRGLVVSRQEMRVSKIFDWYREDFGADNKRLMKLFAYYADDNKALYILGFNGDIEFSYDARLNSPDTNWPL